MRFCIGVYMNIVKAFKIPSACQVEIGNALLCAVTGEDFVRYDDGQVSDLFHCKKNIGDCVVAAAQNLDLKAYIRRFKKSVMELIDANELSSVVVAIKNTIAEDSHIKAQTIVDPISRSTKHEIIRCSSVYAPDFLAGTFLYALLNVENKGLQADVEAIDEAFLERARSGCGGVALKETAGKIAVEAKMLWKNGLNSVSVIAGDIFGCGKSWGALGKVLVTIPVDTSFGMGLACGIEKGDPFLVSPRTLHGRFVEVWMSGGNTADELERRIEAELDSAGYERDSAGHFPIGSIATVDDGRASYCLVAISEHDTYGNTQSTKADIEAAIASLVLYYDRRGLGYPLLVPLVGTGRSRAGLGYQESFELVLECLLRNRKHVQGEISIVVLPGVFRELDIEKAVIGCGL